jgi:hypothetical protein
VTDRNGNVAACFRDTGWPQELKALQAECGRSAALRRPLSQKSGP